MFSLITLDQHDQCLRSLSTFLKDRDISTRIISFNRVFSQYSDDELGQLKRLVSDSLLIGISFRWISLEHAIMLYRYLKPLNIPIIVGGQSAISCPEKMDDLFEMICISEGEAACVEAYRRVQNGEDLFGIEDIYYPQQQSEIPLRKIKSELNMDLDYSCEEEYYLFDDGRLEQVDLPASLLSENDVFFNRALFFMMSRGCTFNCSYCINNIVREFLPFRRKSIMQAVEELHDVATTYPQIEAVAFFDDDLFMRKLEDIETFSTMYRKLIELPFFSYGCPTTVDEKKLQILVNAGLNTINIGVQSGSVRIREKIHNRFYSNQKIIKLAQMLSKYPIRVHFDFIIANPWEDARDIADTLELLLSLPGEFVYCPHILMPFPNSELYRKMIRDFPDREITYISSYRNDQVLSPQDLYYDYNSSMLNGLGLWNGEHCGQVPRDEMVKLHRKYAALPS